MDLAVHCAALTKSYGQGETRVQALRGIDLEVRTGELMMLVGPSGCGKTTLISIIAGILDHEAGECLVLGQNVQQLESEARIRFRATKIGFVFQAYNLLPTLTAAENAAVPLIINGMEHHQAIAIARQRLEEVGLGNRVDALPSHLSGGQMQRVAIARALIHHPRLIVCDEPTSALDHETGERIMELLRSLVLQEQRTLIVVTHDARIFGYADRIAYMDDGHVIKINAGEVRRPPPVPHSDQHQSP